MNTKFEVDINSINQLKLFHKIFLSNIKEVFLIQLFVSCRKRFSDTRISCFDFTFNASILNYIDKRCRNIRSATFFRCEESMTYFVTNQHIIHNIADIPDRKSQYSVLNIKRCSLNTLVFYHQVFSGKEFSEISFDSLIHVTSFGMWL